MRRGRLVPGDPHIVQRRHVRLRCAHDGPGAPQDVHRHRRPRARDADLPERREPTARRSRATARRRAADLRPQHLLTDVQRHGTVLSWEHGGTPARYEVIRSAPTSLPLSFTQPLPNPSGFWYEGQLPQLVPPGTPGSDQVDVPVPGRDPGDRDDDRVVLRRPDRGPRRALQLPRRRPGAGRSQRRVELPDRPRPTARGHVRTAAAGAAVGTGGVRHRQPGALARPRPGSPHWRAWSGWRALPAATTPARSRAGSRAACSTPAWPVGPSGWDDMRVTLLTVGSRGDVQPFVALGVGAEPRGPRGAHRHPPALRAARGRRGPAVRAARRGEGQPRRGDGRGPRLDRARQLSAPDVGGLPARRTVGRRPAPGRRRGGLRGRAGHRGLQPGVRARLADGRPPPGAARPRLHRAPRVDVPLAAIGRGPDGARGPPARLAGREAVAGRRAPATPSGSGRSRCASRSPGSIAPVPWSCTRSAARCSRPRRRRVSGPTSPATGSWTRRSTRIRRPGWRTSWPTARPRCPSGSRP